MLAQNFRPYLSISAHRRGQIALPGGVAVNIIRLPPLPPAFRQRPLHRLPYAGFQAGDDLRSEAFAEALVKAGTALAVIVRRGQDGAGNVPGAAEVAQHPAEVGAGVAVGDQVVFPLPLHIRQIFQPDAGLVAAEGVGQQVFTLYIDAVSLLVLPKKLNRRGGKIHGGHFLF